MSAAERTSLDMAMLAAWLNVEPDQIPPENTAHLNPVTMAAWKRVGEAAIAHSGLCEVLDELRNYADHLPDCPGNHGGTCECDFNLAIMEARAALAKARGQ